MKKGKDDEGGKQEGPSLFDVLDRPVLERPPLTRRGQDPTAGFHRGNPESDAAWASIKTETLAAVRLTILGAIRRAPDGLTCDELEVALGLPHQTVSARCTELKQRLHIEAVGKRPTRSGRLAAVYKEVV